MLNAISASAQLFSTSASEFHSYSSTGEVYIPIELEQISTFHTRSTTTFSNSTTMDSYSTASMHIANGTIKTAASELIGSALADESGFIPTKPQRAPGDGGTGVPDTPLGFGWDVIILLLLLAIGYTLSIRKRVKTNGEVGSFT